MNEKVLGDVKECQVGWDIKEGGGGQLERAGRWIRRNLKRDKNVVKKVGF